MKIHGILFSLLILLAGQAFAEQDSAVRASDERASDQRASDQRASDQQYAILLDTSKNPDIAQFKELSSYGNIYTAAATPGFTLTLIGPFEDKHLAGEILNLVRASGHYAAYIIKHKNAEAAVSETEKQSYSKKVVFEGNVATKAVNRF